MRHLASQAGLVLRNAALTAELQATIDELRASRRRLVEAQDAERRKIERNLHDGAQQQLIALTIQLSLLEESAGDPAAVRQLAPAVKDGLRAALEDLRDLARGIYPPLLADQGLVPALAGAGAQGNAAGGDRRGRRRALPAGHRGRGVFLRPGGAAEHHQVRGRVPRHGRPLVLRRQPPVHRHRRRDGFDTASTRHGTGLQGMADRLAALGGALHVRSQPGHGTTLTGQLPLAAPGQGLWGDAWRGW